LSPAGSYSAISAVGQLIPLATPTNDAAVLNILAVGVNGNQQNQTVTLNYTDRPPQIVTLSFSDWTSPQNYFGEATVATMTYADKSDGTQAAGRYYVYGYSIPLSGGMLESVTLPNNPNVEILGISVSKGLTSTRAGIVTDGAVFPSNGGLDASGNALLASQLGSSATFNGSTFTFGPTNANDVYTAVGQTLALTPGPFPWLNFLALATFGAARDQVFTVTYTDGTKAGFKQSISDWFSNGAAFPGETAVKRMDAFAQSNGRIGSRPGAVFVYGSSIHLNPNKVIQSVTLPNNSKVEILGMQLSSNIINDSSFESPLLGQGYQYNPASPWNFEGTAGISGNNTGFTTGNPNAPDGNQVAFVQSGPSWIGRVSQSVYLFAGDYTLSFYDAQRGNVTGNAQVLNVQVDSGTVFGSELYSPTSSTYKLQTTTKFHVSTTGWHTVAFTGLNSTGDNTAFIDDVVITPL
jgi:hypothetical protein